MVVSKRSYLLLSLCIFLFNVRANESFVVKKEKKESTKKMKQQCIDCLTDGVNACPETLRQLANMQDVGFAIIGEIANGSFFSGTNKAMLRDDVVGYQEFAQRQETINAMLEKQVTFLKQQQKKHVAL